MIKLHLPTLYLLFAAALLAGCSIGDPNAGKESSLNDDMDSLTDSMAGDGSGGAGSDVNGTSGSTGDDTVFGDITDKDPNEAAVELSALRIEPADDTLIAPVGVATDKTYKAIGTDAQTGEEVDVTDRTVFYVPDNYLVGGFPLDGAPTFSVRLPTQPDDPPQRGGVLTVQAQAANAEDDILTATTELTVILTASNQPAAASPGATPAIPANPGSHFEGTANPANAPQLFYPNDGVYLPPNLGTLEVHFKRGNQANTLFEVAFVSPVSEVKYYTRCAADSQYYESDACVLVVDGDEYGNLAESNQGGGPVELTVRGSDEAGNFGESAGFSVEFAEERVDGALYYWTASSPPRIMRTQFAAGTTPEAFLTPSNVPGANGTCVGCHVISPEGDKVVAAIGNSADSRIVFINDLSLPQADPDYFTLDGESGGPSSDNRVLNVSFRPDGSEFVAAAPVNDPEPDSKLFFHNGDTGLRQGFINLPFTPSHPSWAPDDSAIAMTAISGSNKSSIEFDGSGLAVVNRVGGSWSQPVTLLTSAANTNRFNPTWVPDASLLLFSEVNSGTAKLRDGYGDPSATTWAIEPAANKTPVALTRAGSPGVADDGATLLMDTFPRSAPFATEHRGETLFWFTVSSQRRAGLRKRFPNPSVVGDPATQQLLWMFALTPAEVLAGQDGSHPGFFLPFQDFQTSNHMAEWTQRLVSDMPPPPPPSPPPPPPPPPPQVVR